MNKLKKKNGEIGSQARNLVAQWKEIVSCQRSSGPSKIVESDKPNPYISSYSADDYDKSNYNPSNSHNDYDTFRRKTKGKPVESHHRRTKTESPDKKSKGRKNRDGRDNSNKSRRKIIDDAESSSSNSPTKRKHSSSKKKIFQKLNEEDDFHSQSASFEDCLGFNDVPIKKKKPSSTPSRDKSGKQPKSGSKVKSSGSMSRNGTPNDSIVKEVILSYINSNVV